METIKNNWLTVSEAALYLRCGERILRELVANEEIPHVVFAGKALFYPGRLDAWLLSQEKIAKSKEQQKEGTLLNQEMFKIKAGCPRRDVELLVKQLLEYKEGKERFVNGLGRNLQNDLDKSDYGSLTVKVYAQLSRWCHPRRHGERENWTSKIAKKISICLFGKVIERISHPSYRS